MEIEELEKTLEHALIVFNEMQDLHLRLKGSDNYQKDIRQEMVYLLLDRIKEKSAEYEMLKEQYEKGFLSLKQLGGSNKE